MKTPVERLSLRKRMALEVFRKMRANQKKLHPLRQLFWECTQRCNIHCKHCGSDCKRTADIPDMPSEDFLRVVDSLMPHVNPHDVNIVITGGEPLVRDDLEQVGLALYHRGFPWGMVTNGLAYTTWALAMDLGNTAKLSNLAYLTPFLSLVYIFFLLHEPILLSSYLGLVFILAGVLLQVWKFPARRPRAARTQS